jgi:hypothetical protein
MDLGRENLEPVHRLESIIKTDDLFEIRRIKVAKYRISIPIPVCLEAFCGVS